MTLPDHACRIGTLARRMLRQAGRGQVLASCTGAIYLRTADGAILWIQGLDAPMHRRAIGLLGMTLPRVGAGMPFQVERETLRVGSSISIDLRRASPWTPLEPSVTGRAAGIVARAEELFAAVDTTCARELGSLIPLLQRGFESDSDAPARSGDPVLDAAGPHAIGAALACRDHDLAALESHAAALVGLGRGLTPSGDDFVGGLLFVLHRVPGLCPASFVEGACSIPAGFAHRTSALSFAILADHAAGHGNALEHGIVSGLCEAFPADRAASGRRVARATRALVGMGLPGRDDCRAFGNQGGHMKGEPMDIKAMIQSANEEAVRGSGRGIRFSWTSRPPAR